MRICSAQVKDCREACMLEGASPGVMICKRFYGQEKGQSLGFLEQWGLQRIASPESMPMKECGH